MKRSIYFCFVKFFLCKILVYTVLYPHNITFAIYPENEIKQDGSLKLETRISPVDHWGKREQGSKELGNCTKLKNKYSQNEEKERKEVNIRPLKERIFIDALKRKFMLNELKSSLLLRPNIIESKLRRLEKTLIGNNLISESKMNEVKEVLSESESMETRNIMKVLKENLLNNQLIRNLMLKEIEDILLGNELCTEFILNVLNKKILNNRVAYLSVLNEYEKIILDNNLIEESKLKVLKDVLLSDKPITEPQLYELKLLLLNTLYNISNSTNNEKTEDKHFSNDVPKSNTYSFSQNYVSPRGINLTHHNNILPDVYYVRSNNTPLRTEPYNISDIVKRNNIKNRENISIRSNSTKRIGSKYQNVVMKKDDIIKTSNLANKKLFFPKNDVIENIRGINRRKVLPKNYLLKKTDVADTEKYTTKYRSEDKIVTIIKPNDKLSKNDSADKSDKSKIEEVKKRKQWTIEIHMCDKKRKDDMIKGGEKKTVTSIYMCDKNKKSKLIDTHDSIKKGDEKKEENIRTEKKFTIDIHMNEKKKRKPLVKKKTWVIKTIMKRDISKRLNILRELYNSNEIDVDMRDDVYGKIEKELFQNVLTYVKIKPNTRKRLFKRLAIYALTPVLAISGIIGFSIGLHIALGVDLFLDSTAVGLKETAGKIAEAAPEILNDVGTCAVEVLESGATSISLWGLFADIVTTGLSCVAKTTAKAVNIVAEASLDGMAAGTAYGTTYGVMQYLFPPLIGISFSVLILILYRVILFLYKKGKLEGFGRFVRRCKNLTKRKYNKFKRITKW
ncbi:hypothetical protein PGO_146940 [Plasmodium gonderi]|uniref:Uncharacterized protein n=1 Tax=Plasmodium gonderi TaxID=77519 RepID=A0A1Y1JVH0_PLAGO|nr:hypothetical protein PGO_146940 [Plasmodium gonderi]GAW83894.1 hypothetical protein PGO_146940 [Plasmodium gonderi]